MKGFETKNSTLKPCPFCGGELNFTKYHIEPAAEDYGVVKCENCGTGIIAYSDTLSGVIEIANKRAFTVNVKFTDEQIDEIIEKAKERFINEQQQD